MAITTMVAMADTVVTAITTAHHLGATDTATTPSATTPTDATQEHVGLVPAIAAMPASMVTVAAVAQATTMKFRGLLSQTILPLTGRLKSQGCAVS